MRAPIRAWLAGLAMLAATAPGALADKPKKDKPGKGPKTDASASVTVTFTSGQRDAAHGWYGETYGRGNCPPGLAKKNNGCLPPGQAKKRYVVGHPLPPGIIVQPVPPVLFSRLDPVPAGYEYVVLDGDLVKLAVGTRLVVDAISAMVD
jgi:hypothetical protein